MLLLYHLNGRYPYFIYLKVDRLQRTSLDEFHPNRKFAHTICHSNYQLFIVIVLPKKFRYDIKLRSGLRYKTTKKVKYIERVELMAPEQLRKLTLPHFRHNIYDSLPFTRKPS
jgi:hypothetical protein